MSGGTFDLADNAMIINSSTARLRVLAGYAGRTWAGKGITSSYAAAHPGMALGYASAADLLGISGAQKGTPLGETVPASAVLVRLTLWPGTRRSTGGLISATCCRWRRTTANR